MATKRTTSAKKPAGKAAAQAPVKRRATPKTDLDRRWSILLFALGALFVVLAFVPGAAAWDFVRTNILFGAFGIGGWLLGPLLIYWAVLISLGKPVFGAVIKGVLFLVALSGIAVVFSKLEVADMKFAQVWKAMLESGKTGFGGGLLGIVLGAGMLVLIGRPAANVLLVVLGLIALMVLTGVTPGDVARFFGKVWAKRPRRAAREYEEEYDDEPEQADEPPADFAKAQAQQATGRGKATRRAAPKNAGANGNARRKGLVDIDLGPEGVPSEPGLAEHDEVEIGPGGTFGMNPLQTPAAEEPLMPFDPTSTRSLFDQDAEGQMNGNILLFGKDDPYVNLGGAASALPKGTLFDTEYIPPEPIEPEFDLFSRAVAATPVQVRADAGLDVPFEQAQQPPLAAQAAPGGPTMAGDMHSVLEDRNVDAMIDRAAAVKPDTQAAFVPGSLNQPAPTAQYYHPPLSLFQVPKADNHEGARDEMKKTADLLVSTLASFGVQTRILDVSRGPSVTRYEVQPQAGVKISRITGLADDIALNLAAAGVRIEAPIPGKPAVGIEVPNRIKSTVSIRSILESKTFAASTSPLSIALGKDIAGETVAADLTKMPHLLIAGSTGSGKSVCVNATIMSFLYKSSPEDVRLLLIDPKVVELAEYNGIPHLLMPVVTEPRKAAGALGSAVAEMERRYHLFADNNVRDIRTFNKLAEDSARGFGDGTLEKLPYIAIVIDELADLMMTAGKEVEDYICRIAQKARAAGMHLIVATQRPSVDVITGLIKANIPSRIAFAVSSQVDSRTILDGGGAEKLLGMGDMLFMPVGANKPVRVQGTYVQDKEISAVLNYIKTTGNAQYDEGMIEEMERRASPEASEGGEGGGDDLLRDATFISAVETALEAGQISTSFLQRRLRLGYARAGRIMDEMERMHIVSPPDGSKPRQVLISRSQWLEMSMNADDRQE